MLAVAAGDSSMPSDMFACLAGGETWRGRVACRKKDGATYETFAIISPIKNRAGEIINYVSVERDVTRELEAERYMRQSQKMEAIGTLAGGIAHDFNNILAVILGYAELACKNTAPDSTIKSWLDQVFKAAERARALVKQILAFSRRSEVERRPVQVHLVVKEALKLLRATIPTTIDIRERIDTSAGLVIADPTELHQVLMNLCTNAAHAMEERGGVLTVSLGPAAVTREESGLHPELTPGSYVRLSVGDTGAGIAPDIIDKIFDPFFTTKALGKGTGMGLSVVHGIVKGSGGAITVNSTPGSGAIFDVLLPRVVEEIAEQQETLTPLPTGTEHILIVDDEELVINISREMLVTLGYSVTGFTDSVDALAYFTRHPEAFDLIITDQTMPRLTGFDFAGKASAVRPDIPVILCTGFSEALNDKKIADSPVKALVMKPMNMRELAGTIRSILDGGGQKTAADKKGG